MAGLRAAEPIIVVCTRNRTRAAAFYRDTLGLALTSDVEAAVIDLRERGVVFSIHPGFNQNELGILTVPGTAARVAWFKDPDGNVLSVTNA